MPAWLILAKGPAFRFTLAILIFGLLRLILLTTWDMLAGYRRSGDRRIPVLRVLQETLAWFLPVRRINREQPIFSYASFLFHAGILAAMLFLQNHIDILAANTGLAWPAFSKPILDAFTLATILAGTYLLLHRVYNRFSRRLSRWMDYLLLFLILNIFVSGFIAGQSWNPFFYDHLMLFHTANGMILLVLIPFTKIAHCVLFPLIRLASEISWRFTPVGGAHVTRTLHNSDGRKV